MGFDAAKHTTILTKILKDIFTDPSISPYLGFKGGTAAAFFYDLNRFSVDLDFDLLKAEKEDEVFQGVKSILERYGKLKEARIKRSNLFYILSYDHKDINAQNVKIEINRREFGSAYEVKSFLGISMKVMTREDMFAHKLCAMIERIGRTNRDIFDVQFFFSHDWPVNKKMVENRTGMAYGNFLQRAIDILGGFDDKDILAGMGELLTEKQKAWAKTKLKAEALFYLQLGLKNESLTTE